MGPCVPATNRLLGERGKITSLKIFSVGQIDLTFSQPTVLWQVEYYAYLMYGTLEINTMYSIA